MEQKKRFRISRISALHYGKLALRSVLFLASAAVYLCNRLDQSGDSFGGLMNHPVVLGLVWILFAVEMAFRFFPSGMESMGSQKQFRRNYLPVEGATADSAALSGHGGSTFAVVAVWLLLNAGIGGLYLLGIIDGGILLLICLFYSVCDMICILFFCPFQTWFMKNKCCGSCRIYNWDYAMMFTPLLFVRSLYTWSLLFLSLGLLVQWEIMVRRHPDRFFEATNQSLRCANCKEKLCQHKNSCSAF